MRNATEHGWQTPLLKRGLALPSAPPIPARRAGHPPRRHADSSGTTGGVPPILDTPASPEPSPLGAQTVPRTPFKHSPVRLADATGDGATSNITA